MSYTKIGLMALDPGTTTGMLFGTFKVGKKNRDTVEEVFARSEWTVVEVPCGDEIEGAAEIATQWGTMERKWGRGGPAPENRYIVYEDFILRPGKQHSSVRSGLSPVRVTAALMGMLHHKNLQWVPQQPADAKSRWDGQRLRKKGLWVVGSEHKRDAMRHGALFFTRLLS